MPVGYAWENAPSVKVKWHVRLVQPAHRLLYHSKMTFVDILGYAGTALNVLCCIPQVIKVVREGHADGLAAAYVVMGFIALVTLLIYVLLTTVSIPLILNYLFIATMFGTICKYKFWPRR